MSVKVNDARYKALRSKLKDMGDGKKRTIMRLGIFGEEAAKKHDDDSPKTIGEIAAIHQLGAGVPRRPWLTGYFDQEGDSKIAKRFAKQLRVYLGDQGSTVGLNQLGSTFVAAMQKYISSRPFQPNKPETSRRKGRDAGGDTPLVATSRLRTSISYELVDL